METDRLVLPDGTALPSPVALTYRCSADLRREPLPGAVAAATLEAEIITDADPVLPADALDYYRGDTCLGRFYCRNTERRGGGRLRITASDAMVFFERNVYPWLRSVSWPVTLQGLLEGLCGYCGVPLAPGLTLPGGEMEVGDLSGGFTGQQLLGWIGQITGRFFRITPEGFLLADWYGQEAVTLGGDVALVQLTDGILADRWQRRFALRTGVPYCLGQLRYSGCDTLPVEQVLVAHDFLDICWPPDGTVTDNSLMLRDNPLLDAMTPAQMQQVCRRLYEQLQNHSHRPFTCTLIPGRHIGVGSRVSFVDAGGIRRTGLVTRMELQNGCCTVTGTGSLSLTDTGTFHAPRPEDLQLRMEKLKSRMAALESDAINHVTLNQMRQLEQRTVTLEEKLAHLETAGVI